MEAAGLSDYMASNPINCCHLRMNSVMVSFILGLFNYIVSTGMSCQCLKLNQGRKNDFVTDRPWV